MKIVNYPITVPDGDYCWNYNVSDSEMCPYFDNEGAHPHCSLGFHGQSKGYKKSPDCVKLVGIKSTEHHKSKQGELT
jgi:hypothetical protein